MRAIALVLGAACALAACGFAPPKPPVPPDGPRVPVNATKPTPPGTEVRP